MPPLFQRPGTGSHVLESKLIDFCERRPRAQQFRREYFTGVAFEAAVRRAAELCEDSETLEWLAANARRRTRKR